MSYGPSAALQEAVYQALTTDPDLGAIVGDAIYDAVPQGPLPPLFVSLGTEKVTDRSDQTGRGTRHELIVSVITDHEGFAAAKTVAGAVSDALTGGTMPLSRGHLIAMNFHKAKAARVGGGDQRQIDLTFRAFVEDD